MRKINITVGDKKYTVSVAETEEQKENGLQNKQTLEENSGMLFVFDEIEEISMWMKDTEIPLDIIFINDDLEVINIHEGIPKSEEMLSEKDVSFVLEVNTKSGIKKGDDVVLQSDQKLKSNKMLVLKEDGTSQMTLEGGERIFSRANTKILIKFAKKAAFTKKDKDYKALGTRVFKFLQTQEDNPEEYVDK